MTEKSQSLFKPRNLALAGAAVVLVWLVMSRSFVAYLADAAPNTALWLNSSQPEALINLADLTLNTSAAVAGVDLAPDPQKTSDLEKRDPAAPKSPELQKAPGNTGAANGAANNRTFADAFATIGPNRSIDLEAVRLQATVALTSEPLNSRALRILGQISATGHDNVQATKFMTTAVNLSLHQSIALYWLMRQSTDQGDYKSAISYADALLRTNPNLAGYIVPVLAHFADGKESVAAVKAVLDGNPPWRSLFFRLLPQDVTDARVPLNLLIGLKNSATPPTSEDVKPYVDALLAHKYFDLAYYTWLQFLPLDELRSAGLLFNGNFATAPSGMPFDWTITQGSGVTIDILTQPNATNQRALSVAFLYGRVDYHSVRQLVVLPPGDYQFSGQYTGTIIGPRGMKWRITCTGDSVAKIGESAMIIGVALLWKKADFNFSVPQTGCRAQFLSLDLDARMASEQIVSGAMLFDDLRITRVTQSSSAATTPPNSPAPLAVSSGSRPVPTLRQ
ncbi:MAG TPA: hypothetical protein VH206_19450 [Xanthobacteraceae bacterium]|jgi:hypothetical protein|nr:hypothetical protein [Xanthobacteraceae bacterium]